MKRKLLSLGLVLLVTAGLAVVSGCGGGGKRVKLIYVEWSSEIASTHVVKNVLEMAGYKVETIPVSAAAMWKGLATGDADAMVCAWLPTTHGHYLKQVGDKIRNLGSNLKGTRIGLVVPEYVTINSIAELNANADKFGGEIVGIDPGAGLMSKTEKVLKTYKLDRMKLREGSGATMTAALKDAIARKKWIVVTGWTPHWKFARWKLKYLQDPKNIYGGAEYINTFVRSGLKKAMPGVYKFLDNFNWTPADMQQVMVWNQEKGADYDRTARRWIKANGTKVAKWLAGTGLKLK